MLQIRNRHIVAFVAAIALALGVGYVPASGARTSPQAEIACKRATIG